MHRQHFIVAVQLCWQREEKPKREQTVYRKLHDKFSLLHGAFSERIAILCGHATEIPH